MTCKITMDWSGLGGPRVGMFFKAPRGRTAYEIVSVRKIERQDPRAGRRYTLSCERHAPADVPEGASWIPFHWNKR